MDHWSFNFWRITEEFRLDTESICSRPLPKTKPTLGPLQAAQSFVCLDFENLWGRNSLYGNLVCCLIVIMGKNSWDTSWINLFCYYFAHGFYLLPMCHCEQFSAIFFMTLCRQLLGISAQLLTGQVLLSPACLPLRPLQFFHAYSLLGRPKLDIVCRCGPMPLFIELRVLSTLCLPRSTLALSLLSTRVLQFFSAEMLLSRHSWRICQCMTSPPTFLLSILCWAILHHIMQ